LAFDANGNLTDAGEKLFAYDSENRLTKVTRKADGLVLGEYQYDALGRRVAKTTASGTTQFYYHGWQVIEEQEGGQVVRQFVDGLWIDDHLVQDLYDATGMGIERSLFYLQNHRGDTVKLVDGTGTVVQEVETSPYGEVFQVRQDGGLEPLANPGLAVYLFQGRRLDGESEVYYFRMRYYDAGHGRFLQRDPLEYVDGMGLYEAFRGNSFLYLDFLGLRNIIIIIFYRDPNAIFNKRVFDFVEEIFQECFRRKKIEDKVYFVWESETNVDRDLLGWGDTSWGFYPKWVGIELHSAYYGSGSGQSGGWRAGLNASTIKGDVSKARNKGYSTDQDIAVANVIAHEIGLHVISGDIGFHIGVGTGKLEVDRVQVTYELQGQLGHFSEAICDEIIDELDLEIECPPQPQPPDIGGKKVQSPSGVYEFYE
jgi:RHS repeat-associated protein